MSTEKQDQIRKAWKEFERQEPDMSTERLLEMVKDKCAVDIDCVIAAMVSDGYWSE